MLDHCDALRGAEFPHDNPELFSGPGWLAVEPCGGPKAIAWASQRDLHYGAPRAEVEVLQVPPAPPEPLAPAEPTDFDRLLAAVRAVVLDPGVAAELERFLRTGSSEVFASEPQALVAGGWRRLLSGAESDLAACGDRPLDEWVAGLVGACLHYDAAATAGVRRDLRKRGVAAFGMLGVSV